MEADKVILPDSPEAQPEYRQVSGWVSPDGHFFGADKERAMLWSTTHRTCSKYPEHPPFGKRAYCRPCVDERSQELYESYEEVKWDGNSYIAIHGSDEYFADMEEVSDYAKHDLGITPKELRLVQCKSLNLPPMTVDYWEDFIESTYDLPSEILDALEKLNTAVEEHGKKIAWIPDKKRIII